MARYQRQCGGGAARRGVLVIGKPNPAGERVSATILQGTRAASVYFIQRNQRGAGGHVSSLGTRMHATPRVGVEQRLLHLSILSIRRGTPRRRLGADLNFRGRWGARESRGTRRQCHGREDGVDVELWPRLGCVKEGRMAAVIAGCSESLDHEITTCGLAECWPEYESTLVPGGRSASCFFTQVPT